MQRRDFFLPAMTALLAHPCTCATAYAAAERFKGLRPSSGGGATLGIERINPDPLTGRLPRIQPEYAWLIEMTAGPGLCQAFDVAPTSASSTTGEC